jgi:hypothetical protein
MNVFDAVVEEVVVVEEVLDPVFASRRGPMSIRSP